MLFNCFHEKSYMGFMKIKMNRKITKEGNKSVEKYVCCLFKSKTYIGEETVEVGKLKN